MKTALEILNKHIDFSKDGVIDREQALKAMEEYSEYISFQLEDAKEQLRIIQSLQEHDTMSRDLIDQFKPKWVKVMDEHPPLKNRVMLLYLKGCEPVMAEGYLTDVAIDCAGSHKDDERLGVNFWRKTGRGLTFFDYADRQIQNLVAKNSKNNVTHWMPLPTPPEQ